MARGGGVAAEEGCGALVERPLVIGTNEAEVAGARVFLVRRVLSDEVHRVEMFFFFGFSLGLEVVESF